MTHLVLLFTVSLLLEHLEAVLSTFKILSCTDNRKYNSKFKILKVDKTVSK